MESSRGVSIYIARVRLVIAILPLISSVFALHQHSLRSLAQSVVLVFMTRTLNSNVFFLVLVLLLLASFHCTPKLTSSAPNYLRKLRVKSRQPVIYFTSIEVEKNKVEPEGSTKKQRVLIV